MKLWKLYARPDLPHSYDRNPWEGSSAKVCRFVVRAETEQDARRLVSHNAGAEDDICIWNPERTQTVRERRPVSVWLDAGYSVCEELTADGLPGVVL